MKRTTLVDLACTNGKTIKVTPDTFEAIGRAKLRTTRKLPGYRLVVSVDPAFASTGMEHTGREIHLRLMSPDGTRDMPRLWSVLVPLGFTPWERYPLPRKESHIFHYLGPWQRIYDHLISTGHGEHAWKSTCLAATVDIGKWNDSRVDEKYQGREVEIFLQSQLHRLGYNIGNLDGRLGAVSIAAIQSLGIQDTNTESISLQIASMEPPSVKREDQSIGYLVVPGMTSVQAWGLVSATRTPQGAALSIQGAGRVVIDIGND